MGENQYLAGGYTELAGGYTELAGGYTEEDVNTATPMQLIVILYDTAIRACEEACSCMERKDISGLNQSIDKCSAVISELQTSLNLKEGGEIAKSLNNLYDYIKANMRRAGAELKSDLIVEVRGLLENLGSAWRQAGSDGGTDTPAQAGSH